MKNINNFISEKLKLINQSKLKPLKWTIETAERGDIITINEGSIKLIFIFEEEDKEDDGEIRIRSIAAINVHTALHRIYLLYDPQNQTDYFFTKHDAKFSLATEREKQLLFDKLKEKGYKWNDKKKEIKKIKV